MDPEPVSRASRATTPGDARLLVEDLKVSYDRRSVLHGVSLSVDRGEIVTVLGHNGAGKTTLLKAIFGSVKSRGAIVFEGHSRGKRSTSDSVRDGISFTPAEAPIFRDLTVAENLQLGAFTAKDADSKALRLERVHELFPVLANRGGETAGKFSGGQQRMLAIGIALMSAPRLMLLDEPSLGIAPSVVNGLFKRIRELCDQEGLSVLLVEQNVRAALPIADRAAFLRNGAIILEEPADVSLARGHWWDLF